MWLALVVALLASARTYGVNFRILLVNILYLSIDAIAYIGTVAYFWELSIVVHGFYLLDCWLFGELVVEQMSNVLRMCEGDDGLIHKMLPCSNLRAYFS